MSNQVNPYQPPQQPAQQFPPPVPGGEPTAPCPNCGNTFGKTPAFTWWGGLIGAKMLKHVHCTRCGTGFNSRSGKSNNTAITIYVVVGVVIGGAIGIAFALMA
jgi:hypothetical protein